MIKLRFNLDSSPTYPPILQGSKSAKFGLILVFEALQYRNEVMYLISNTNLGSNDNGCMF